MTLIQKEFLSKSTLDGPPFQLVVEGKSRRKLRKWFVIMFFLWIYYVILRSVISDPLFLVNSAIFITFYIPALLLLFEHQLVITGDHGDWKVLKTKKILNRVVILKKFSSNKLEIELRVVSYIDKNVSYIIVHNEKNSVSIKTPNKLVKDFIDDCEAININVKIRKRGKQEIQDDKANY
jgi:hypothetical protein